MRIEINIPKEFENHFNEDKFKDSFERIIVALKNSLCTGRYEYETIEMLEKAFEDSKSAYNVDKVVEEIKTLKEEALVEYNMGEYNLDNNIGNSISENYRKDMNEGRCFAYDDAIEIVEQGGVSDASDDVCEWIKYDYRTICPRNHDVNNPYWRIPDNMDNLKYCPYCGKKIKVVK